MEEIKMDKKYQKLMQKCQKEFQALVKKNQKELIHLRTKHRSAVSKLESTFKKTATQSLRLHNSDDEMQEARHQSERELNKKVGPLAGKQEQEVRSYLEANANSECDLLTRHQKLLYEELRKAVRSAMTNSAKNLQSLYSQEHAMLKKTQERQRNAEMREITKQFKDKTELREARKEFQQKQVMAAVAELQALDSLHKKWQHELQEHEKQLLQNLEISLMDEIQRIECNRQDRLKDAKKPVVSTLMPQAEAGAAV